MEAIIGGSLICYHNWKIQCDILTESIIQQLHKSGCFPTQHFDGDNIQSHILIMICSKCGAIFKSVEQIGNFDE